MHGTADEKLLWDTLCSTWVSATEPIRKLQCTEYLSSPQDYTIDFHNTSLTT